MPFSRAKAGEEFVPSAEEHNAFIDVALHHRNRQRSAIPGTSGIAHPERLTCQAKNNTGAALAAFSTAKISGLAITPVVSSGRVRGIDAPVLLAGTTTADADDRPIVYLAPVAAGKPAMACLAGLTPALVNVSDASHEFAVLDDSQRLKSTANESGIRIIFSPGTGTDQLCVVVLAADGGGKQLVGFTLTSGMSGTATASLTDLDGNSLGSDTVRDPKGIFAFMESGDDGLAIKQNGKYYVVSPETTEITVMTDVQVDGLTLQKKTRSVRLFPTGAESAWTTWHTGGDCST